MFALHSRSHPLIFPPAPALSIDAFLIATALDDSSTAATALFPCGGSGGSSAGQMGHGMRVTGGEGLTGGGGGCGGGQPGHPAVPVWKRLHIWHIPATAVGKNTVV